MAPTLKSPRPFTVTDTSRGAVIIITGCTLMSWMVLCFMFRVYTRLDINGPLGMDDLAAGVGSIFGIAHIGVLVSAVTDGLGNTKSDLKSSQINSAEKGLYISDIFFLFGHYAAKISVALLIQRLGRERLFRQICLHVACTIAILGIVSALAICFKCDPSKPWLITDSCVNVKLRWQIITAFDVLSELVILGLVVYLVWALRMAWIRKFVVVAAFGCRIPIIGVAVVRLVYIDGAVSPEDPTLQSVDSSICTEALLFYSLMAATIPCLKPFVVAFNTGWGQGKGKGSSYVLRDSSKRVSEQPIPQRASVSLEGAKTADETPIKQLDLRPETTGSDDSQRMMIKTTRSWVVEHESYEMERKAPSGVYGHSGAVYSAKK